MTEQFHSVPDLRADLVVERLPRIFRIQSITRLPFDDRHKLNRAVLYHESASLQVEWVSRHPDIRLVIGTLVSICWSGRPRCSEGAIRVARIFRLDKPEAELNLFATVPPGWVRERDLVRRAADLVETLPRHFRHLFNAIFWKGARFHRYLSGPSSLGGHHDQPGGNLRHSVEVAEQARALADQEPLANAALLVMAALLHDAGKADEYEMRYGRTCLSARGELVGHRHTIVEWIAAARAAHRVIVPESQYLALIHALTAARGAPAWLGMREPRSLDATLLSHADRMSGQRDLISRNAPQGGGFGRYHKHLRARPFVLPPG